MKSINAKLILLHILIVLVFLGCSNSIKKVDELQKDKELKTTEDIIEEESKQNTSEESKLQVKMSGDIYGKPFLGRPTDDSITISTIFSKDSEYYFKYGIDLNRLNEETLINKALADNVDVQEINALHENTKYYYQLYYKNNEEEKYNSSEIFTFNTQKVSGINFKFLVEADPHLDEGSDGVTYEAILSNMLDQNADFIIDLGDASMIEKFASNEEEVKERNILVRSYWDNIAHSMPLFMVLGNHDGEFGWENKKLGFTTELASDIRKNYFPNPNPDLSEFYAGESDTCYSWKWGDALFVVLDPFTYTQNKPKEDNWEWTLGKQQYDWLKTTLEESDELYKFVFIHHLVGGLESNSRGGIDLAPNFEWGGNSLDGLYRFDEMRPDWEMPIHELLKTNNVDIVFHGHDHFFAKEELDGIIYQLVPQPSPPDKKNNTVKHLDEYGYSEGVFLPSPGYLSIEVTSEYSRIEYLQGIKGVSSYTYDIQP